ncbi:unnamed protein product [Prorocentrum cordatum]|uniref:Reverse transcriptase domain-containing protein n=1 Tax=Prorocentrum cordatum TaxID=2364126 RepID=A0ABN9UDJ2_9DINO|nr:unnamed protein product [Polarella glacialis]
MPELARRYMQPGREVIVRYDTERRLWHRRTLIEPCDAVVLARVRGEPADDPSALIMWVWTPTGDIYPEELSVPPLLGIAPCDLEGTPMREACLGPPSHWGRLFESGQVFRPAQYERARAVCRAQNRGQVVPHPDAEPLLDDDGEPDDGGGALAPVGAAAVGGTLTPQAPPASTSEDVRILKIADELGVTFGGGRLPAPEGRWVDVSSANGLALDSPSGDAWVVGPEFGMLLKDGTLRPIADRGAGPVDQGDDGGEAELDARILEVSRDRLGKRFKDFKIAVDLVTETAWVSWPLTGPRTTKWCLQFILQTNGHPRARHSWWKSTCSLSIADLGVSDHETAMKALEYALTYDQVNAAEVSFVELLLRRAQLAEYRYKHRLFRTDGQVDALLQDEFLHLGVGETRGQLMLCPLLEEFVASELHRESTIAKESRKLNEERRLQAGQASHVHRPLVDAAAGLLTFPDGPGGKGKKKAERAAERILTDVYRAMPPPPCTAAQALSELGGSRPGYADSDPRRNFQPDLVSLPSVGGLADGEQDQVRYSNFAMQMLEAGLVTIRAERPATVGIFFVAKKDGRLRMILDTRAVNDLFDEPAHSRLPTPASWASVEIGLTDDLTLSQMDVDNAFYRCKAPPGVSDFFALPRVSARHLHQANGKLATGLGVTATGYVTPHLEVMAMGWSWALYFCRAMATASALRAGVPTEAFLLDKKHAPDIAGDKFGAAIYVDNAGVIGACDDVVSDMAKRLYAQLAADGLQRKELEHGLPEAQFTGMTLDRASGRISVGHRRCWKVRLAIAAILEDGFVSGKILHRIVGRFIWSAILRRCLLSIPHSIYRFIEVAGDSRIKIWPAVARELRWTMALLPLAHTDSKRPWSTQVVATDSEGANGPEVRASLQAAVEALARASGDPDAPPEFDDGLCYQDEASKARSFGQYFLEVNKVTRPSALMYDRYSRDFQTWTSNDGLPLNASEDISFAMLEYLEDLYFQGHNHDSGEKVIAALEYRTPGIRSAKVLERAKIALKGFRRLAPGLSRAPLPWIGLRALVGAALHINELEFAQCLVFLFRTYLRPRERLGLRVDQLVPPPPGSGTKFWALLLAPEEEAIPTKTKEFDESILLDSPELVCLYPRFSTLKKRSGRDKFSSLFKRVSEAAGLGQANLHPCMMRHGGASDDALRQTRSLEEIKRRGRWAADTSVKRYEKHARVLKSLECLPKPVRDYGLAIESQLHLLLALQAKPPPPPGLGRKRLHGKG